MDYACAEFGDIIIRFGYIMRTNRQTHTEIDALLPRLSSSWSPVSIQTHVSHTTHATQALALRALREK